MVPSPDRTELPGVRLYRDLMDRRRPDPPEQADREYKPLPYSFVSLEGYLNARLLTEVLDRLGDDPRRDRVREATAESIKDFDLGIGAPASFGQDKHPHQALDHVYFTVARDGRFVDLVDDEWRERWGR